MKWWLNKILWVSQIHVGTLFGFCCSMLVIFLYQVWKTDAIKWFKLSYEFKDTGATCIRQTFLDFRAIYCIVRWTVYINIFRAWVYEITPIVRRGCIIHWKWSQQLCPPQCSLFIHHFRSKCRKTDRHVNMKLQRCGDYYIIDLINIIIYLYKYTEYIWLYELQ